MSAEARGEPSPGRQGDLFDEAQRSEARARFVPAQTLLEKCWTSSSPTTTP